MSIPLSSTQAAAVFMEEANYDVTLAKSLARRHLSEPEYAELQCVLAREQIDSAIDQAWRSGREVRKREVLHGPQPAPVGNYRPVARIAPQPMLQKGDVSKPSQTLQAAFDRHVAMLLHFEMPNGTRLCEWNKRTLHDLAQKVKTGAQSTLRTADWWLAICEMLPKDDSVVQDVLVEADLERLYRRHVLAAAS